MSQNWGAWRAASALVRRFNKTEQTIRNWCQNGTMVQLGYHVRKDETGHWFIKEQQKTENSENPL